MSYLFAENYQLCSIIEIGKNKLPNNNLKHWFVENRHYAVD